MLCTDTEHRGTIERLEMRNFSAIVELMNVACGTARPNEFLTKPNPLTPLIGTLWLSFGPFFVANFSNTMCGTVFTTAHTTVVLQDHGSRAHKHPKVPPSSPPSKTSTLPTHKSSTRKRRYGKQHDLDNNPTEWSPETYRASTTQKSIEGSRKSRDRYLILEHKALTPQKFQPGCTR